MGDNRLPEPIAIVGISHRFPGGASTNERFWELLSNPTATNLSRPPPAERLNLSKYYHPNHDQHGSTPVSAAYFLDEDPTLFDNSFFSISPLEAEAMDPQQRLLLETIFEASEGAGITLEQLRGSHCSVFVGVMTADYELIQYRDTEDISTYTATGTARSILANRISHFFDLRGQSTVIDTACSSSLVALHLAVQDIRSGNSKLAVVAGCNLMLGPDMFISESKLHMLSPTGTCKMWDSGADGYARGEGVASLILKPLSAALKDGDPIRAVIRHTGVNSDGRTQGITVPSASAQAYLIRQTYEGAGLDPLKMEDQCQYFEAHGTGTKAGDPQEARGISEAFFPGNSSDMGNTRPLLVGSAKTVIGHLEGCAGLAGIIKTVLAMQHETVLPNLHLNNVNPDVAPYMRYLQVPTSPVSWPTPAAGHPKRASVNSFGFGGTNAHVILESYAHQSVCLTSPIAIPAEATIESPTTATPLPILLSAQSQSSLAKRAKQMAEYLQTHPEIKIEDIAWTLWKKRSELSYRQVFTAHTREELVRQLEDFATSKSPSAPIIKGVPLVSPNEGFGVLGVFTGQGAQWAGMGRELLLFSPLFRRTMERCDEALANLPDAPSWTLVDQLLNDDPTRGTTINDVVVAQPATTALELGLVDMLVASGIRFCGVVGHSSGEMAACYAAGILTLEEAICIAYYRGLTAEKYVGKGSMLAVGLRADAAHKLCLQEKFQDRLWIAAKNAPSSVTLSGDVDAVLEAKADLDDRKVFNRVLRTGKAYHSPHMAKCATAYLSALKACQIRPQKPRDGCVWISSVHGHATRSWTGNVDGLDGDYWIENLLSPVLFTDTITAAFTNGGPYDVAIEIGPHHALKTPVMQTVTLHLEAELPYYGCIHRGENAITTMSKLVGVLGGTFGRDVIDLGGFQTCWKAGSDPKSHPRYIPESLPSYPWDHDMSHWRESRISCNRRLRADGATDSISLLGRRCHDDSDLEPRWRNFLDLKELSWLRGHAFQGEILFPATGHLCLMLEAAGFLARGQQVEYIEICDVEFQRPIRVTDGPRPVEILCSSKVTRSGVADSDHMIEADFACYACSEPTTSATDVISKAILRIHLLDPDAKERGIIPPRTPPPPSLLNVDVDRFYTAVRTSGLEYEGAFKSIESMSRVSGFATARASWAADELGGGTNGSQAFHHPSLLDTALQPIYAAFAAPSTDKLWTAYLPQSIEKVLISPMKEVSVVAVNRIGISIDAHVTEELATRIVGDVYVATSNDIPLAQFQGVAMAALERPSAANDRNIFSQVTWEPEILGGADFTIDYSPPQDEMVAEAERVALFYARRIVEEAEAVGLDGVRKHEKLMIETLRRLAGEKGFDWADDTETTIERIISKYPDQVDFTLMRMVNSNMGRVLRKEKQMVDVLFSDSSLMKRFYAEGLGLRNTQRQIAKYMHSIVHRYPRASILEVGAGTGATTSAVLDAIGDTYGSYTFTDVSVSFFPRAEAVFADHADRMDFRKFDIAAPFEQQGFSEEAPYDVVIAANVLHITEDVDAALHRVRKLLKPGGYLIVTEPTSNLLRIQVILGGLDGWWCTPDSEQTFAGPVRTCKTWDDKLRQAGFSGIDLLHHDQLDENLHTFSSFVTQAVDDRIECIRSPLDNMYHLPVSEKIVIVGGLLLSTSKLVRTIQAKLRAYGLSVTHFENLRDVQLMESAYVLMLSELDEPAFQTAYSEDVIRGVQVLLKHPKALLAVTKDAGDMQPFSHMLVGLFRGVRTENPSLNLQLLNLERSKVDSGVILEHFVRLVFAILKKDNDDTTDILHTIEPQIALRGNATFIPRVVMDGTLNDRVNCRRRQISRLVSKQSHIIEVNSSISKIEISAHEKLGLTSQELVNIHVDYSTISPMSFLTEDGSSQHLCIGRLSGDTQHLVAALSKSNTSEVEVSSADMYGIPLESLGPDFLGLMGIIAAVKAWLQLIPRGRIVCLHGAKDAIVEIFKSEASIKAVRVFTTSDDPKHPDFIHLQATPRQIMATLPANTYAFIVCGPPPAAEAFLSVVRPKLLLPKDLCRSLFGPPDTGINATIMTPRERIAEIYASAIQWKHFLSRLDDLCPVIPINEPHATRVKDAGVVPVLDWISSAPIYATIRPINPASQFRPDRTYFLVGLTGEVGMSICTWMIKHGVRHVVLASRAPQIDPQRLRDMTKYGATVRTLSMNVTDLTSVQSVVAEIAVTMPPVAGVCNGSMVLADGAFQDMDKAQIDTAIEPKVQGSLNLDKAFSMHNLDFFIMMSSLGSIIGTPGQANYHMANTFIAALAANRRRRGLAGSVLDVGYIADIGYVSRQDVRTELKLRAMRMMPLCEEEVHIMFSEAIAAGRADSLRDPEIVTGLLVSNDDSKRPHWAVDPRLSHFVVDQPKQSATDGGKSGLSALQDLQVILASPEVDEILLTERMQAALSEQFETLLRLPPGAADMGMPLMSLGLDSLVAMEVQRWFRKNVGIEISALQILGGATGQAVCRVASASVLVKRAGTTIKTESIEKDYIPQASLVPDSTNPELSSTEGTSTSSSDESIPTPIERVFSTQASALSTPFSTPTPISGISQCTSPFQQNPRPEKTISAQAQVSTTLKSTPLSFAQARLWFLHHFLEDPTTYNETVLYNISGSLDIKRLRDAFYQVANHHETLRTRFQETDGMGVAMQSVMSSSRCSFNYLAVGSDDDVQAEYKSITSKTWNLVEVDGVSWIAILRDWDMAYRSVALPRSPGYAEFSDWQRQELEKGGFSQEIDYWKQELAGVQDLPLLPMARVTTRVASNRYEEVSAKTVLDAETVARDFCIGMVDTGRSNPDFSETVGFFINIVPVRVSVADEYSFESFCRNLWAKALKGLENSRVPFDALLDALQMPRTTRHSPLFQVVINYRLNVLGQNQLGDCAVSYVKSEGSGNPYDLCLNIMETPEGTCHIEMCAKAALYSEEAVLSILDCYLGVLDAVPSAPRTLLSQLPLNIDRQESGVDSLDVGRGEVVDCDWEETVSRRIARITMENGDAPAVACEGVSYSYAELMRQASIITSALLQRVKAPSSSQAYCCLLFEGSMDYVASFLGVLQSGIVAVPLDTRSGKERLAVILEDCKPRMVLYHNQTQDIALWLQSKQPDLLFLDASTMIAEAKTTNSSSNDIVVDRSEADGLVAMFYTSGTTSKPKGVLLANTNCRWIVHSISRRLQLRSDGSERIIQQTALGFDMSIMQLLLGLCNGGCLVVASARERRDPWAIAELLAKETVTCMIGVPTEWMLMFQHASDVLRRCAALRTAAIGGEMFPLGNGSLFEYWRDDLDRIPVGPTLDNVSVYILDESGQPVPNNCTGEVFIGGCGVGRGYLDRPDLTSAAFTTCSFATSRDTSLGWRTMYRTGDRGFLRPDGQLVILGRVESDAQIKLRGIRIELDDIAGNIVSASRGKITQAAVTARGETKMLVGYAVLASGVPEAEVDDRFLDNLAASLPLAEYMKPAVIIPIAELPKTLNGKLDRHALDKIPLPAVADRDGQQSSTLTSMEIELSRIWKEILPRSPTDIEAARDFFRLGGNSVLLVALRKQIQTRWRVKIPLVDMFEASTLRSMAALIRGTKESQAPQSDWEFWDNETRYHPAPVEEVAVETSHQNSSGCNSSLKAIPGSGGMATVLMTGATDTLLGLKLLELLTSRSDVAKIYCVAVSPDGEKLQLPPTNTEKITIYHGSLGDPALGLSDETQSLLRREVDIIIHAGAEGSCLNTYTSLRQQNVESTTFLAYLATPRKIPIHYVSSARVVLFTGQNAWPEASVSGFYPPSQDDRSSREGFTATKWASEMLLEDFHARTGSPVTIHRTGYLMSEQAHEKDIMNMIYKYSVRLRAVPSMATFSGFLDMSDVQVVAESFVESVLKTHSSSQEVTYKHHTEDQAIPVGDLGQYLQDKYGHPFDILPMDAWVGRAEEAGMSPFLTEFLSAVVEKGEEARCLEWNM
ncbi:putative polyketide synthase [Apiospora arundinis]